MERDNMSEKTLASGKQMLTVAGRILTGLASAKVDKDTATFWVDKQQAMNYRTNLIVQRPTVVQAIGYRLSAICGLGATINSWWAEKFDVFAIDTMLELEFTPNETNIATLINPCADIVVVDNKELYAFTVKALGMNGRNFSTELCFVNFDPNTIPITGQNIRVYQKFEQVLAWIGDRQYYKIESELQAQLCRFMNH